MSKILYKLFTSFLVTSFLTTAFFCSCGDSAEISLVPVHHDEAGCCDFYQGKTSCSSDKHCDCYVTKIMNADVVAKTFSAAPVRVAQQWFISNSFFSNRSIDVKHNLSYIHGPPCPVVVAPLYIQFHSFRI